MQVGRVALAVAAVAMIVSGCGGPGQAGSAVIVGTDAVPLERVQSQLVTALAKADQLAQQTGSEIAPADVARDIVSQEVMHNLLARRAAQDAIVVTDAQVDAYFEANGGVDAVLSRSLSDLPTTREQVRDFLVAAEIGQRVTPGLAVTIDMMFVASRDEAGQVARTLAAGGPEADALFVPERDPRLDATFQAASSPNEASTVVFGVPVGTVGYFPLDGSQSQWLVFHVVDRRTDVPSDPAAIGSISQSQLALIGQRAVQPDGEALGIRVNPRYGEWDPVLSQVVAEGQQGGEIILPAAPPAG